MSQSASTSMHPLITQNLVDTKKFFCPFLERGYCREASRCNFSHDNCESIKIPNDYCHFYLANQCLYGQECKFRHSEPEAAAGGGPSSDDEHTLVEMVHGYIVVQADHTANGHEDELEPHQYQQYENYPSLNNYNQSCSLSNPEASTATTSSAHLTSSYSSTNDQPFEETELSHRFSSSLPSLPSGGNPTVRPLTSFAKICKVKTSADPQVDENNHPQKDYPLCPYSSATGECQFPPGRCSYLHGLDCDLCGRPCLHPYNLAQQRQHREDCLHEHEREMELSFAVQRSRDKVCGICMDTVVEKKPITSSRFGILEKCNHIFCLDCIRKWRGTKQFETRTIRACPECRVSSDFVVPSKYWVEDQDDKDKLIQDYKAALRAKPCKYFNEGKGDCPFAGSCFYKHAYPDGRIAKMESPKPRRRVYGARGPTSTVANYILWNLLTSTDDDDWSNDELESLYLDPDYVTTDDEDLLYYDDQL